MRTTQEKLPISSLTIGTTVVTGATPGSVLFAGAAGVIAQDNASLFWDDTNNRLGIGTAGPADPLHIVVTTAVAEIGRFETTVNTANVVFGFKDNSPGQQRALAFNFLDSTGSAVGQIAYFNDPTAANQYIRFNTNSTERFRIQGSNIGFNATSWGTSAAGVIGIGNGTAPSTSPAGMGQLYVESGALKYRGSSGTITVLGIA
jgi:hypothetical protein